jgi:hypothetical protein
MSIDVSDFPHLNQFAFFVKSNFESNFDFSVTNGDYHCGAITGTGTVVGNQNDDTDTVNNATTELSSLITNIKSLTYYDLNLIDATSKVIDFSPGNYYINPYGAIGTYTFNLSSNLASDKYVFRFSDTKDFVNIQLNVTNPSEVHTNNIIFLFGAEAVIENVNIRGIIIGVNTFFPGYTFNLDGKLFLQYKLKTSTIVTDGVINGFSSCFAEGTRIVTPKGTVLVEELKVGDEVWTRGKILDNKTFEEGPFVASKIIWTGNYSALASDNEHAPVLIRKGALGPKLPSKDLYVSRNHSVIVSGEIVPAYKLINGTTIEQIRDRDVVRYYHFELEDHTAVLAHGLLTESYLDTGNRYSFTSMQRGPLNKSVSPESKEDATVKTRVWPVPNGSANGMMKSIMIAPSSELTQN